MGILTVFMVININDNSDLVLYNCLVSPLIFSCEQLFHFPKLNKIHCSANTKIQKQPSVEEDCRGLYLIDKQTEVTPVVALCLYQFVN